MRRNKTLTIPELEQLLAETRARLSKMQKKRVSVASRLAAIDREIAALAPDGVSRGRKIKRGAAATRGKKKTLKVAVYEALGAATQPLEMRGLEAGVRAAGYQTKSKNLVVMLRKAVSGDPKIARAGRGLYTLATLPTRSQKKATRRQRKPKADKNS